MRALTLNVLFGGEDRFTALCDVVKSAAPDVVILQECVGWEHGRHREMAAALGFPVDNALLGLGNPRPSGTRYNIAILSRFPILRTVTHATGFAHCALEAELDVQGERIVVVGTHLVWSSEDERLQEAAHLLDVAKHAHILAGDLNALTRHDPYGPDLDEKLQRAGIHKYGHPPRFDVMDALLSAGWVDALRARPRDARWVTALREKQGVVVETRSDYVLVSRALAPRLQLAEVVDVGEASDHHAVIALVT